MINTSPNNPSDRYQFKDFKEVIEQKSQAVASFNSLCINCSDYYEIPPCQSELTTDGGCFPSLTNPDRN